MTVAQVISDAAQQLQDAGIASARLDAELLLASALGVCRERLILERETQPGPAAAKRFHALVRRRAAREPVAHILGEREFWSLSFAVGPAVLTPRPESETVIEAALESLGARRPRRILDLGTGSGCLLLALLHALPEATGMGTEASPQALALAQANAESLGLAERARFLEGDWSAPLAGADAAAGGFDLVVSNPPYIATSGLDSLMPEVRDFEPRAALDGGPDGLDAHRRLAREIPAVLAPGGQAVLEIGADQAAAVGGLLAAQGLELVATRRDLGGRDRAVCARVPG